MAFAPGGVEAALKEQQEAVKRIEKAAAQQQRFVIQDANVEAKIKSGSITEEDAHRIFARKAMRSKAPADGAPALDRLVAAAADYQTTEAMLEEVLEDDMQSLFRRKFAKATGLDKIELAVKRERNRRKKKTFTHTCPWLRSAVHSIFFEILLCLVLLVNGYIVSSVVAVGAEEDALLVLVEHACTGFMVVELLLKFTVDGWTWIWNGFHLFDTLTIIFTGILPLWILPLFGVDSIALRAFQVVRMFRLFRLAHNFREYCMDFWEIVHGLAGVGPTVGATFVILMAALYMFGILSVTYIGRAPGFVGDPDVEHFGNFPAAFLTLFRMTMFDSWVSLCQPLMERSSFILPFLMVFFWLVPITILNLTRGLIISGIFKQAADDEEIEALRKAKEKQKKILELQGLFEDIDLDGNGVLTKDEFDEALQTNEWIQRIFKSLNLKNSELDEIWDLLDVGSGEVTIEQFSHGLLSIGDVAKAKDSYSIVKRVQVLAKRIDKITKRVDTQQELARALAVEAKDAHRCMGGVTVELLDFMEAIVGWVPHHACTKPSDPLSFHRGLNPLAEASAGQAHRSVLEAWRTDLAGGAPVNDTASKTERPSIAEVAALASSDADPETEHPSNSAIITVAAGGFSADPSIPDITAVAAGELSADER